MLTMIHHNALVFILLLGFVYPLKNVTIDNDDPLIVYLPPGAWGAHRDEKAVGGSFKSTDNDKASATFTFRGELLFNFLCYVVLA